MEIKITRPIQWAVICSNGGATSVHNTYEKAVNKKKFLNEEYKGECTHRIVKVKVELLEKAN